MSDRPFGVTIVALVQLLGSLATLYGGSPILMKSANANVLLSPSTIFTVGILTSISVAFGVLLSYGLFTLKPWAWEGTVLWQGLTVLLNLVNAVTQSANRSGAIVALIVSLVVVCYLCRPEVKRAFPQR